jgi:TonB family protein
LSKCKKIDKLLWAYPDLTPDEMAELQAHLAGCQSCTKALETIQALKKVSADDQATFSAFDTEEFDTAVWRKIDAVKRKRLAPVLDLPKHYGIRLAFSFGLATLVVLFIFKSISDIGNMGTANRATAPTQLSNAEKYGRINIEIAPKTPEPKAAGNPVKLKEVLTAVAQPPATPANATVRAESTTTLAEAPALQSMSKEQKAKSADQNYSIQARQSQEDVFSILPAPVVTPSPDSVNIGAVYVTNENIPIAQQSRAASLAEVFTDTGAVQNILPQSSRLITVEKMPKPIKIAIPDYPVWAKKQNISGTVWIKAKVEADGTISEVKVVSCDRRGVGFEEEALKSAKENLFLPASSNGINISVWVVYPVKFISTE